jgi:hypothetical protein
MARVVDDRTDVQRITHCCLVVGTDRFMTRLGRECGQVGTAGRSLAAWACQPVDLRKVFEWAKGRGDLKCVRTAAHVRPKRGDHVHIYVVDEDHVSVREEVANDPLGQ